MHVISKSTSRTQLLPRSICHCSFSFATEIPCHESCEFHKTICHLNTINWLSTRPRSFNARRDVIHIVIIINHTCHHTRRQRQLADYISKPLNRILSIGKSSRSVSRWVVEEIKQTRTRMTSLIAHRPLPCSGCLHDATSPAVVARSYNDAITGSLMQQQQVRRACAGSHRPACESKQWTGPSKVAVENRPRISTAFRLNQLQHGDVTRAPSHRWSQKYDVKSGAR
jgi:hypothetical protein